MLIACATYWAAPAAFAASFALRRSSNFLRACDPTARRDTPRKSDSWICLRVSGRWPTHFHRQKKREHTSAASAIALLAASFISSSISAALACRVYRRKYTSHILTHHAEMPRYHAQKCPEPMHRHSTRTGDQPQTTNHHTHFLPVLNTPRPSPLLPPRE